LKPKYEYTTEERALFKKLQRTARVLKKINQQFPVSFLDGLLEIALKQGLGSTEYAERLETSKGNGSRILGTLGDRPRRTEVTYEFITQEDDPLDSRKTHYFITAKGNALLKQLARELES
jgi:DNA-binding MarR family transcriptional regulator